MKKEKRQLRYPGLKAGSIYGTVIFFIIPLIDTLTSENPNFISSLLNTKHIRLVRNLVHFIIDDGTN